MKTAVESRERARVDRGRADPNQARRPLAQPISIYEVHPGSWMRVPEEGNRPLTAAEMAPKLVDYLKRLNFTHVEFFTLSGRPLFATSEELRLLIDQLHQHDLGVILDEMAPPDAAAAEPESEGFSSGNTGRDHADGRRVDDAVRLNGGGLELKWDVCWERNLIDYLGRDPVFRKFHHSLLTSRSAYAFSENFILPLPHHEVMPGRGSLIARMNGDDWQRFANLRLLYAFMHAQPGKKLIFMGNEFGQWNEWRPDTSLDWHLLRSGSQHERLQRWVAELNHLHRAEPALHEMDADAKGFEWSDDMDAEASTLSWVRKNAGGDEIMLAAFNFTPVPRHNHRVGVPGGGFWREILNSDAQEYGGSGQGNLGGVEAAPLGWRSKSHSLTITLPPLGAVFFKRANPEG